MKSLLTLSLALICSTAALAEPATITSISGRLKIPNLVIDGRRAFTDVEFIVTDVSAGTLKLIDYESGALPGNFMQEQELAFGESFEVVPGHELRFFAVLSDSRCPSDVLCISAGEVTVIMRMIETLASGNTLRTDFGLTMLGTDISWFEHKGIYYRLVKALPYPVSTEESGNEDYVITIEYQSVPFKP